MLDWRNSTSFRRGENSSLALRNFSEPEDGFVWSHGKWCEIVFEFAEPTSDGRALADLVLDLDVFHAPPDFTHQSVLIYLNGLRIASSYIARRPTYLAPFASALLKPSENVLTIDTPDVIDPRKFGVDDARYLGIQLFSLQIRRGG